MNLKLEYTFLLNHFTKHVGKNPITHRITEPKFLNPSFHFQKAVEQALEDHQYAALEEDDLGADLIEYAPLESTSPCPVEASSSPTGTKRKYCSVTVEEAPDFDTPHSPPRTLDAVPAPSHKHQVRAAKRRLAKASDRTSTQQNALRRILSHGSAIEIERSAETFDASRGAHTGKPGTKKQLGTIEERRNFYQVADLLAQGFEHIKWDGK